MLKVLEVNVDDHLYGGVYVLVKNIIANLPSDITADIAALEPFDDNKHIEELHQYGSSVYYVGSKRCKILKQLDIYKNVKKIVAQNNYDVVHLHSDVSHKILVSAIAVGKKAKLIFHSHNNDAEGKHIILRRLFHEFCCCFLRMIPATYIATSSDAGKWMFPWAKEDQIIILDNGIDYKRYYFNESKRIENRKELNIGDSEFLIGMFGRFVFQKNPFFALEVLRSILKKKPNTRMLCIGEGPLKDDFIRELKVNKLFDKVIFVGNTDRIEDYYQAIDALIMPSNFEGFGLVAVESQISGTPTFVSDKVPDITKISNLIKYLPIGQDAIDLWQEQLGDATTYKKHAVENELNRKFELSNLVSRLVDIYKK